jgi:hypothetical protein
MLENILPFVSRQEIGLNDYLSPGADSCLSAKHFIRSDGVEKHTVTSCEKNSAETLARSVRPDSYNANLRLGKSDSS